VRKKGSFKRSHENGRSAKHSSVRDGCTDETSYESDVKYLELINVSNVPKFKLSFLFKKIVLLILKNNRTILCVHRLDVYSSATDRYTRIDLRMRIGPG